MMMMPSILNNPLITTPCFPSYLIRRGTILVPPMNLYGYPGGILRKSINPYLHRRRYDQVFEGHLNANLLNDIKSMRDYYKTKEKDKTVSNSKNFVAMLEKGIKAFFQHVEIVTINPTDKPIKITPLYDHSPYCENTSLFSTYLDKDNSKLTKDFLQEYKILLEKSVNNEITKEEINLQKQLETFIDNHKQKFELPPEPRSRESEEYSRLYPEKIKSSENAYETDVRHYMSLEKTICFLPEQFEAEISRQKKGLYIIENYFSYLKEPELMEIIRRAGLTKNPDAIYEYGIVKQGEGPKILAEVYRIMQQEHKGIIPDEKKVYPNTVKILESVSKGEYYVGTIERDYAPNTLILSGQDLHMVLVVEDPDDINSYLIQAMFTSAKDSDAIKLSDTQPTLIKESVNIDTEIKPQMIRFLPTLKRIAKTEFKEDMKFTKYAKNTNYENINIKDKIIAGIINSAEVVKNNPIEYPLDFTSTIFITLVKTFYQKTIDELTLRQDNLNKKLTNILESDRKEKIDKLKEKESKFLNEKKEQHYYNNVPPYMKNIIDNKRILDSKIKSHMDKQTKLKKGHEIALGKEIKETKIKVNKEAHQKQLKSTNEQNE